MAYWTADDGVNIYYKSVGNGSPIVFVSGWTMSSWHWQCQLPLAEQHRVVMVDLRGHGRSGKQELGWTLAQAARDVHGVIEYLDLRDVTLVGWSMGSYVLFEYVEQFGEDRLKALCSVEMTPRNTVDEGWEHGVFGSLNMAGVVAVAADIWRDRLAWQAAFSPACFAAGAEIDQETLDSWTAESLNTPSSAAAAFWVALAIADWRDLMPKISVPTLLCHGTRSQAFPTQIGAWMEQAIPRARLISFAESGHAPFWEEAEMFNDELSAFVATLSGSA